MFFPSKKKRLWRARVTQPTIITGTQNHYHQQQTKITCSKDFHQPNCNHNHPQHHHQQHHHQQQQHHHHHHQFHGHQLQQYHIYSQMINQKCPVGDGVCIVSHDEASYYTGGGGGEIIDYGNDQTMSSVHSAIIQSPKIVVANVATATTMTTSSTKWNCCTGGNGSNSSIGGSQTMLEMTNNHNDSLDEQKETFRALVGKLKESQLSTLCQVIENGVDGHQTDCVLVPRCTIMDEEPNVIACRLWRWSDLKSVYELKRIPSCPNEKDRIYICCNPSHWSRLCLPDTPPPPYQLFALDRLKPEDRAPSESIVDGVQMFAGSLTTDGEDSSASMGWCQLAYWEQAQRVGSRFPVENSSVNIFSDQPRGDGMCLKTLADQRQSATPESVRKARQKIGLGVTLSQEADGVWLYNRSSVPVFVHSPTLNDIVYWFHVSKVPPGYCLRAFDNYRAKSQTLIGPPHVAGAETGPVDTYSMRISFAKGWGPNYTRQDVTACPCWLEVLLTRR